MNELEILLIGLAIAIGAFFLFRGLNLWYWRINELVDTQKKQTELLSSILEHLKGTDEKEPKNRPQNIKKELSNELAEEDIKFYMKDIKSDELIVRVKQNSKVEKWKVADWEEVVSLGNSDKFELLYKN